MAFTYSGVSPTEIVYNNTSLTSLQYGSTKVWGKPYSLSISAGANTSVTVNRTASPNQHASTGNLSNGSVIYYGDTLTISYSVSSGYQISTHTVNGTTFTSGTSYTVTGAISVVTTAIASQSWHTIWTGTMNVAITDVPSAATQTRSKTITVSGLRANTPTRIYISQYAYTIGTTPSTSYYDINLSQQRTSCGLLVTTQFNADNFENQSSTYLPTSSGSVTTFGISIDTPTTANTLPIHDNVLYTSAGLRKRQYWINYFSITSIEQYY